ncbi:NAD(P)-dependent oxidoreductase [Subtercola boreus]|uniref:3-hydroxyisobutyrate dehydrogenase n=1 Tax=Subtercola boreus TaxID=120213 RepID=A0A3E0WDC7_9MICO|nr:NAD(P)-dependent oxidoreductase [Subtercola boreus]RFA22804.1 3-hydroxyisobutyrate dehydrogenase [Subtercola boreus]RFA23159.1 3-hydroxyisobutyrate dehydrogenase [Subtercola boreus]RFA28912.1 3-hydroxyisobutyrate dehydrogenase [Subtercola boreus]
MNPRHSIPTRRSSMHVAVLGTGTMGAGVARSLLRAGIEVTAWNRHRERAEPLAADGATVTGTAAEAVSGADVVLTVLFDEEAVAETAREFLGAMRDGAVWMQSATVGVAGLERLADLANRHGVTFVDAPMVGTKKPAEEGMLVVLVAGDPLVIRGLAPVLDAIGSKTVDAGERPGAASALKLACNAWVASLTAATAQSIQLCRALGVDPELFLSAIDGGPSNTPYAQLKGGMMLAGDYTTSFAVDGLEKDLTLMLDAASGVDVSTALLEPLREVFAQASAAGHGGDDIAAVITALGDSAH